MYCGVYIAHQIQCTMVCVLHTKYSVLWCVYCTLNIVYCSVCVAHQIQYTELVCAQFIPSKDPQILNLSQMN